MRPSFRVPLVVGQATLPVFGFMRTLRRSPATGSASGASLRRRLEALLAVLPSAAVWVDDRGLVTDWSAAAERLTGRRGDEALGASLATVADDPSGALTALVDAALTGERGEIETIIHRTGGQALAGTGLGRAGARRRSGHGRGCRPHRPLGGAPCQRPGRLPGPAPRERRRGDPRGRREARDHGLESCRGGDLRLDRRRGDRPAGPRRACHRAARRGLRGGGARALRARLVHGRGGAADRRTVACSGSRFAPRPSAETTAAPAGS